MAYDLKEGPLEELSENEPVERKKRLKLDDDDFLAIVAAEFSAAIGIDAGDEVAADRIKAMEYFKGDVSADVVTMPNRSKAVSTDVADAIYTALPDLCEIFVGGEEIGAFRAVGEEDEEGAKQETEVVNHVIMEQNDGFGLIHDAIHDALLQKVGIFHFYVEEEESYSTERLEGQNSIQLAMAQQSGEVMNVEPSGADELGNALYAFHVRKKKTAKCVRIESVDPSRFGVARDTKDLRDATYAVMLTTPRAQELKQRGFDPDLVDDLSGFNASLNSEADRARDTAGENAQPYGGEDASYDLRMVAVHVHVVRVDADGDGEPEIWRVITDQGNSVVLDKEQLPCVPFAAGSPYRQPHRFYGRSLADLLMEIQRIKTALTRMHLDGGFFAINQRHEIDVTRSTEWTLQDYLNNVPGNPVRTRGSAISPLTSTRSDFNALESLEYWATVAEQRSGVVRNAQGLNPDTLHDTARGAEALMSAAQKRLRFIARTLAETLFKGLFVGVHTLLRTAGSQQIAVRLRNKWTPVDPSSWGERNDMTIEIGLGAAGRDAELIKLNMVLSWAEKVAAIQQGFGGPLLKAENAHKMLKRLTQQAGLKGEYWTDPETNPMPEQPQAPDPEMVKADMAMKAKQAEMQMQMQMKQAEMAMADKHQQQQYEKDLQLAEAQQRDDMARAATDAEDRARKHELEVMKAQIAAEDAQRKHELDAQKLVIEQEKLALERQRLEQEAATKAAEMDMRQRELEHGANLEAMKLDFARQSQAVDIEDRKQDRATRAVERPKEDTPDKSHEALGVGLQAVGEGLKAIAKPKRIKRGKDGKVEGIE